MQREGLARLHQEQYHEIIFSASGMIKQQALKFLRPIARIHGSSNSPCNLETMYHLLVIAVAVPHP